TLSTAGGITNRLCEREASWSACAAAPLSCRRASSGLVSLRDRLGEKRAFSSSLLWKDTLSQSGAAAHALHDVSRLSLIELSGLSRTQVHANQPVLAAGVEETISQRRMSAHHIRQDLGAARGFESGRCG